MADKRNYTRYNVAGTLYLKNEEGVVYNCAFETVNISFVGMAVYTAEKMEIMGKALDFEFKSELIHKPFCGKAKIIYIKQENKAGKDIYRIGFQFIEVNKELLMQVLTDVQKANAINFRKNIRRQGNSLGAF